MMGTAVTPRQPLPVGFRFQPTNKEIFYHYLKRRNTGLKLSADVPEIEMTKLDPWKLRDQFEDTLSYQGNDNDWWFFAPRFRNQKTARLTESGTWKDNVGKNNIMDRVTNQTMGIRNDFTFLYLEDQGQYTRMTEWKLYEYRLTDDFIDKLPGKTFFVLCHLSFKHDETKNKTGMEVPQTNGKNSSQKRQRKRAMESNEAPLGPVDSDFAFAYLEQQRHRQDNFPSSYQLQSSENPFNVRQSVESLGNNSFAVEVPWGNSSGSGSSGLADFNSDIPSNSLVDLPALFSDEEQWQTEIPLEDQTAFFSDEEQWQTEMFIQNLIAPEPPEVSPHESLLHQGGLIGDTSNSSQQNIHILGNRRTQSAKSLRGVVPAEEKKTVVENRIARPQPSPPLSSIIAEEPKGSKASNSPSSSESFIKLEARVVNYVKKEPTAANPHWKEIGVAKIEKDEELAQETRDKLRLKPGPILITQNQHSLSSRFECSVNVAVGLVLAILICPQMLRAGIILPVWVFLIRLLMKSKLGSTL